MGILGSLQSSTRTDARARRCGRRADSVFSRSLQTLERLLKNRCEPLSTEVRPRNVATPRPPATVARRSEQASTPAKQSPAFFKTPAGIAVLAVLGAGAGYAIYSAQHDRIHSPGKK